MASDTRVLEATRSALLVMGYQRSSLEGFPEADRLLSVIGETIDRFRRYGGVVTYVRMAFSDADYQAVPAHSPMHARLTKYGRTLDTDSSGTAFDEAIAPMPGDVVVRKTRVGAFSTTSLDSELRSRGITTVMLTGVATSGVVLTTLREAFDRDYQSLVLADATADKDSEIHQFLLKVLFPRVATVVDRAGLAALFGGRE